MTRRATHRCPKCGNGHNCQTDLCAICRPAVDTIGLGPGRWMVHPTTRVQVWIPRGAPTPGQQAAIKRARAKFEDVA
jgi:hypothetical protein